MRHSQPGNAGRGCSLSAPCTHTGQPELSEWAECRDPAFLGKGHVLGGRSATSQCAVAHWGRAGWACSACIFLEAADTSGHLETAHRGAGMMWMMTRLRGRPPLESVEVNRDRMSSVSFVVPALSSRLAEA